MSIGMSVMCLKAQDSLEKLPEGINTVRYDESVPVLSLKGDKLFFTRTADPDFDRTLIYADSQATYMENGQVDYIELLSSVYSEIAGRPISDPFSSPYNQDIWYVPIMEDETGHPEHPGYPLNNALPNSLVSTGMNGNEYVVINQFYRDGSMYAGFSRVRIQEDGESDMPTPMHIYEFNLSGSDVNMTMPPDGHVLVISMPRSDSRGHNDLYVSFFVRENVWSAPVHMGPVINSAYQETTPHLSGDKRYLYFSSNRPDGEGGHDLYVSERLDYTWLNWSAPKLLTGGINSSFDESQPYFDPQQRYMYFSSRRDGTSDIFRQRLVPRPALKKPVIVRGTIVDAITGKPVRSELLWGQSASKGWLEYFNSSTGHFSVELKEYDMYKFLPRKMHYTAKPVLIDPRSLEQQGIESVAIVLMVYPPAKPDADSFQTVISAEPLIEEIPPLEKGQTLVMYNIHFLKGKPDMLAKSRQAMQHLLNMMREYPALEIMIEGHTDNVGEENALQTLSLERANAVKDYLVLKGIDTLRIQTSGKGASSPLSENVTERDREKNRRVEIKILKLKE